MNEQNEQKLNLEAPDFYAKAFDQVVASRQQAYIQEADNFKRTCAEEYNELSKRIDQISIQDSCSVRNVLKTRRLAKLLISDQGNVNLASLTKLLNILNTNLYSIGPNRQYDTKRNLILFQALKLLNDNPQLVRLIQSIDKPYNNPRLDQLIRETLSLPSSIVLTNAHARRAVLSAWMCTLRQNVGSCFATAPGIIIHDEQPEFFLNDLIMLISTGQLKRTFGGVEYSVPLSMSWGSGNLKKPFFLNIESKEASSQIWIEPGIEAAFTAAHLIDLNQSASSKAIRIKHLITESTSNQLGWTTAEDIIRGVLLHSLKLKHQDILDEENKPKAMIYGSLLMQSSSTSVAGKLSAYTQFNSLFQQACNAFKELADNALLKTWEFTLASFAETKAQFTKWNLYSSLGMEWKEEGGIGACIYKILQYKLQEANSKVADMQVEYEQSFQQLKAIEGRVNHITSEREGNWVRAEYQSKRNEFYTLEELRNKLNDKAHRLSNLYQVLMDRYDDLFPSYFQEVYDADMHDVSTGPYDDSPAGFRLLYKHGRANTAQWSYIKTPSEYIESLVSFFTATESEIYALNELQGLQTEVSEIITAVINHVRTNEFLESSFYRMARAHNTHMIKDPLHNLDKIEKKPWAYTSGGTMSTLVSCYYKLNDKPAEVNRYVDMPLELSVFLVDTLRAIPPKLMEKFQNGSTKSMLMHSPTHAFLLKPCASLFKSAWQNDLYTYTWVRDHIVLPRKKFIDNLWLDEEMMSYLVDYIADRVPEDSRKYFKNTFDHLYGTKHPVDFRKSIVDRLLSDKGFVKHGSYVLHPDLIDSALFSLLPLFSKVMLRERVDSIFSAISVISTEDKLGLMKLFDELSPSYSQLNIIDADTLQNICKGLICLHYKMTHSAIDFHALVSKAAQDLGFTMPAPFIFADTNWVKDEFGFVVNPGTGEFELWRVDITGRVGAPMSPWKKWLDGSHKEPTWGVCNRPYEYGYTPSQVMSNTSQLINKIRFLPEKP